MKSFKQLLTHVFVYSSFMIPTQLLADGGMADGKTSKYHYETMKIKFDKNSSNIDIESRKELRKKMLSLKSNNDLDQVTIAGFADQAYPPQPNRQMSDLDSKLAHQRIDSIETTLSGIEDLDVDVKTYNLGEDPNILERWFNTSDYQLKTALKDNLVLDDRVGNLKLIKDEGEVSSAIVIFRTLKPTSKSKKGEAYSE